MHVQKVNCENVQTGRRICTSVRIYVSSVERHMITIEILRAINEESKFSIGMR